MSQRKNRPPIRRKLAPSPLALRGARHAIMLHLISSSASSASVMEVTAMTARSLSLKQALSISGGSQMMETVDSIYNRSAVGYFNNLRVPAAVLMSIISKEMFALQSTPPAAMRSWDSANGVDKSKVSVILPITTDSKSSHLTPSIAAPSGLANREVQLSPPDGTCFQPRDEYNIHSNPGPDTTCDSAENRLRG